MTPQDRNIPQADDMAEAEPAEIVIRRLDKIETTVASQGNST
jgi:hypothetical protein